MLVFTLFACSEEQSSDDEANNPKTKTQLERVLSPQLDALEKSKKVEQQLLDASEIRKKEMQKQGI